MASRTKIAGIQVQELRSKVAFFCRVLDYLELIDFSGHVSARLPGTDRIFINPRTVARPIVTPRDIVVINLDGELVEGESAPPSESRIHTSIYQSRSDVYSVAHLHSPMATLVGTAKLSYVPVVYHGAIFADGVPLLNNSGHIDTPERGREMATSLGNKRALLIRGHGAVVTAASVEAGLLTCICLEENAKYLWQLSLAGKVTVLSADEINEGATFLRAAGKLWKYYAAKLKCQVSHSDFAAPECEMV